MAIKKIIVNGTTNMDLSADTTDAQYTLQGYTGHKSDGTTFTGTYVPPSPSLQSKTTTPTETAQTITPDGGYDGLSQVDVGAIDSEYVGSDVPRYDNLIVGFIDQEILGRKQKSLRVSATPGYYEDSPYYSAPEAIFGSANSVSINSSGDATITFSPATHGVAYEVETYTVTKTGAVTPKSSSDLTVSGATVTAPAGYYSASASKSVASGTEGTPTATKGIVSNHQVSITPSVTNSAGYISGGTHTGTPVTVTAAELVSGSETKTANGTYDVTNLAELVVNVSGGEELERKDVNFFGKNGELLYSYTATEFQALTSLPSLPSYSGFTSQEWNWTLADAKSNVTQMGRCDIGVIVCPSDGKTHVLLDLQEDIDQPFKIKFNQTTANGVTVDWGDGTATQTQSGIGSKTFSHTYSAVGTYEITLDVTGNAITALVFPAYNTSYHRGAIKRVNLGLKVTTFENDFLRATNVEECTFSNAITSIGQRCFNNNAGIRCVIIPNGVTGILANCFDSSTVRIVSLPKTITSISASAFTYATQLSGIVVPYGCTSIGNSCFTQNRGSKYIALPNSITSMGTVVFQSCTGIKEYNYPSQLTSVTTQVFQYNSSLQKVILSNNLTKISNNAFSSCIMLKKITIPSSVTSIGNSAFSACNVLFDVYVEATTPPTLGTSVFPSAIKHIYVPSASLSDYQAATNWSSYSSKMVGV